MKIKVTYTAADKKLFDVIRAEMIRIIPCFRIHESNAPDGVKVWYLSTGKNKDRSPHKKA